MAALLTAVVVFLHVDFAARAGGLWRDEANALQLATLPTLADVWGNLEFDSIPLLWVLVLRTLSAIGVWSDLEWRVVGCVVGLLIVAVLWFNARAMRVRFPLLGLPLFALCASTIVWGDSLRAYGMGLFTILLTLGLMWRFVEQPTPLRYALAAGAALSGVQTLYANAPAMLAICVAGAVVALRRRAWRTAAAMLSIGFVSALSLVPYIPTLRRASAWNELVRVPTYDFTIFWLKINQTLGSPLIAWAWVVLVLTAVAIGTSSLLRPARFKLSAAQRDLALFALVILLAGAATQYAFLKVLRYRTEPWYYLTLLALLATALDALAAALLARRTVTRGAVVGAAALLGVLAAPTALHRSGARMTNADLVAADLRRVATADDLVVLCPWYYKMSFERYCGPSLQWETIPPLRSHPLCRYDLIKQHMMSADSSAPVRPMLERIRHTLQRGNRVFFTGSVRILERHDAAPQIAPAPHGPFGWNDKPYLEAWELHAAHFTQQHALRRVLLAPSEPAFVSDHEKLAVVVVEGWRD